MVAFCSVIKDQLVSAFKLETKNIVPGEALRGKK